MSILPGRRRLNRQPSGPFTLDQSHPLFKGLVFASVAGGPDLISGTPASFINAATINTYEHGKSLYSPGGMYDAVFWALPANSPLYKITSQDSSFVLGRRINGNPYNAMLAIPYAGGAGWGNPYFAWALASTADTTTGVHTICTDNSNRISAVGGAQFYQNGIAQAIGATRNGTRVRFYRGYTQYGTDVSVSAGMPDFTNKQPLTLFNRSSTALGDQMAGHAGLVLIWNRELSPAEWTLLASNPWQLFRAPFGGMFIPSGSTPVPALIMVGGMISQITTALVGTNKKPIVLVNGALKERTGTEGIPVILDQGQLRTLGAKESLVI